MDKSEISKLIVAKSERIALLPGEGKSDVWPRFMRVVVDGVLSYHVVCNDCKSVLRWKAKDGTSGLKAHMQSCKGSKHGAGVSRKLADCAGVSTQPIVKRVTAAEKKGPIKTFWGSNHITGTAEPSRQRLCTGRLYQF